MNSKSTLEASIFSHIVILNVEDKSIFIPFISKSNADFYLNSFLEKAKKTKVPFVAHLFDEEGEIDHIKYPLITLLN